MAPVYVLITGANSGIGYETVKALLQHGQTYHIFLTALAISDAGQAIEKLQEAVPNSSSSIQPIELDITDDDSISRASDIVSKVTDRLDVLVNNAGALFEPKVTTGGMTRRQAWQGTFNVNVTGTHIMTVTFLPYLLQSSNSRLIFLASGTSSLAEADDSKFPFNTMTPSGSGFPKTDFSDLMAYRVSKTALNMVMRVWSHTLRAEPVKVFCAMPGFLATSMLGETVGSIDKARSMGARDPETGGVFVAEVVQGKRDADAGKIVRPQPPFVQSW